MSRPITTSTNAQRLTLYLIQSALNLVCQQRSRLVSLLISLLSCWIKIFIFLRNKSASQNGRFVFSIDIFHLFHSPLPKAYAYASDHFIKGLRFLIITKLCWFYTRSVSFSVFLVRESSLSSCVELKITLCMYQLEVKDHFEIAGSLYYFLNK